MSLTEAALLREVAVLQRDKTLLAVRDAIDRIPVDEYDERSYGQMSRTAKQFRDALLAALRALGDDA